MPKFIDTLRDWKSDTFEQTLKSEIRNLKSGILPLEKCTSQGGHVDDGNLEIAILNASEDGTAIRVRLGVFFTEIVICCGCGDDPMPQNSYCEMQLSIDKITAAAEFSATSG